MWRKNYKNSGKLHVAALSESPVTCGVGTPEAGVVSVVSSHFFSLNLSSCFLNQSASTCSKCLKIHYQFTSHFLYKKATLCRKHQKALGVFVIKFSEHKKLGYAKVTVQIDSKKPEELLNLHFWPKCVSCKSLQGKSPGKYYTYLLLNFLKITGCCVGCQARWTSDLT